MPKSSENSSKTTAVIVGVGNLLLRDEGVGIHAVRALQELDLPDNVCIVDAGTAPDLVAYSASGARLIIVDAAKAGGKPGTIYRFTPDDLEFKTTKLISLHEIGVRESLEMMRLAKNQPEATVIIGIEPGEIDWGMALSPVLQSRMPEIIKVILREIGAR